MLTKEKMQEIQDLKLRGLTKTEIIKHFEDKGEKAPTRPTLNKYYNMDVLPKNPGEKLAKVKAFDSEPFKGAIIAVLEANANRKFCISSVYDVLMEKFIENDDYESLPGNEQTLRNYVHYLENNNLIDRSVERQRIYDYVFDTPPGEQMLIDFGELRFGKNNEVHFICLLLRYSRVLCVYAQDHKFNANEACMAIYRCFLKLGGRPKVLVIDQDAVFVASETFGEVIKTRVFEDFCTEQELKLWVCNKGDPESKGPVENAVGFVKKNFFSARKITCIDDVWRSLPGWLERKNKRIHQGIFRRPIEVFNSIEKNGLRTLLPSLYENSPLSYVSQDIKSSPYVLYKSSKYQIPREYAFKTILYKVSSGKIHIYDENRQHISSQDLSERKGSINKIPEFNHKGSDEWANCIERMRKRWNCYDFQHFVNGVKKENPRHLYKQFRAIEQFLDAENPERQLVAAVMKECCEHFRYQFSQFKTVFTLAKAGRGLTSINPAAVSALTDVEIKQLEVYAQAYHNRIKATKGATR